VRASLSHLELALQSVCEKMELFVDEDRQVLSVAAQRLRDLADISTSTIKSMDQPFSVLTQSAEFDPESHFKVPTAEQPRHESSLPINHSTRVASSVSMSDYLLARASSVQVGNEGKKMPAKILAVQSQTDLQRRLLDVFNQLDTDGSGFVDHTEMIAIFNELGMPRLCKSVFRSMDTSGDDKIDQGEWLALVTKFEQNADQAMINEFMHRLATRQAKNGRIYQRPPRVQYYVIEHNSQARTCWDMLMLVGLFYIVCTLPLSLAFGEYITRELALFETFLDVFFLVDVVLNFRTTYTNSKNEVVRDGWRIASQYLRTWFLLDLLSSLPVDRLDVGVPPVQPIRLLKVGKVMRVFKMLRFRSLMRSRHTDRLEEVEFYLSSTSFKDVLRLSIMLSQLLLACHWSACLLLSLGGDCVKSYQDVHDSDLRMYLSALYWATMTMTTVGYGDIIPQTDWERLFIVMAMIVGGCSYGYMVGSITSMVTSSDLNTSAYRQRMELINAWLAFHHEIPVEMRRRVRRHFKNILTKKTALEDSVIMNDLSPELGMEMSRYLLADIVRYNALFDGLPGYVLARIAQILKRTSAGTNERIAVTGHSASSMFIMIEGTAEFEDSHQWFVFDGKTECPKTKLNPGDSFGEEILLGFESRFEYTVVAASMATLYEITCAAFYDKFSDMPEMIDMMKANFRDMTGQALCGPFGKRGQSSLVNGGTSGVPPCFPDVVLDAFSLIMSKAHAIEESTHALSVRGLSEGERSGPPR